MSGNNRDNVDHSSNIILEEYGKPTTKPSMRTLSPILFLGLREWPDVTEDKGKGTDARGAMVAVVPVERGRSTGFSLRPKNLKASPANGRWLPYCFRIDQIIWTRQRTRSVQWSRQCQENEPQIWVLYETQIKQGVSAGSIGQASKESWPETLAEQARSLDRIHRLSNEQVKTGWDYG
jgi:hypothetical protein